MAREFDDDFSEFVRRWSPALLRVAFLLTSDRGEAEDLLQTALLKTSRHWDRLADREAAYPYVRRVLVTTHTSWRRRRRVHETLVDQLPERGYGDDSGSLGAGRALQALEQLPPRMRAVVVLRCYEGLSEAETAEALGCSVGSVKSHSSRGLARLRLLLEAPTPAEATR
ncbi:SigE family RNA polymerase sigma factor [Modestobacter sp. I12A-02628]|uniref:SigE family RNA polymerase sigma factor n=1 Tax=Goekera deserti TaxID=2497753 RepID=A0A7K3W973_9ACTN|nr:SigE family RNA polymerase sigma factor [Goekera deserti]MPQ98710.1 SigE family RNA polymerase sigma factor [Goekera deserti]NDI49273.1 SigE family RNA polymerase sigma factor [Goekera deserti]NEL53011.1 SigE family RNA polymerase sigma factor [Goekera deserti]